MTNISRSADATPFEELAEQIGITCLADIYNDAKDSRDQEFRLLADTIDAKLDQLTGLLPHVKREAFVEDATLAVMVEKGFMIVSDAACV